MTVLPLMLLLLQAPGDGWALAQVAPRQVKTLYWELFDTSETWVSLIPSGPAEEPPLVRLAFQAFWPGKDTAKAPTRLVLRALGLPLTVVTQYSLEFVLDGTALDLGSACTAPGATGPPCQLLYPVGEGSSANGVAVELTATVLERLVAAQTVRATALGFPVVLSPEDRAALARFVGAIHLRLNAKE